MYESSVGNSFISILIRHPDSCVLDFNAWWGSARPSHHTEFLVSEVGFAKQKLFFDLVSPVICIHSLNLSALKICTIYVLIDDTDDSYVM